LNQTGTAIAQFWSNVTSGGSYRVSLCFRLAVHFVISTSGLNPNLNTFDWHLGSDSVPWLIGEKELSPSFLFWACFKDWRAIRAQI